MPSQEEFEDKFRKKFEDWDAPAPAWESFQAHIPPVKRKSKNKYRFLLWWCVSIGIMLGGSGIGAWLVMQKQYTIGISNKTYPSTAKHKVIQENKGAESINLPARVGKDSLDVLANLPTYIGKDSSKVLANLPTYAGKDSIGKLAGLPTEAGKDSVKILANLPTQAGKDTNRTNNILTNLPILAGKDTNRTNNIRINLPTQAGKDSANVLANLPTHAGKDSTRIFTNLPTQTIDSTQKGMINRLVFAMNGLPVLPLKSTFDAPTPNYRIDTTWKWDAKKNSVSKWAIAGYVAPIYAYKIVKPNTRDSIFIENFVANKRMTAQNRGYQIGGRIERRLGKRLGVYGGLQYQYSRLQMDYVYYAIEQGNYRVDSAYQNRVYLTPILPRNAVGDVLVYHSLSAEVGVHYRLHWRRWESLVGVGIGYQYALNLYIKSGAERYRVPYGVHQFMTQASWQIGYALTPRKRFFAEPIIQNNHTRLFKGGLYDLRTYQVGWRVGVKWRL
ncbi:MAG: hypothetical protein EAZ95_17445 [Bacteroidetes bacterium]|nr:MAG: hypothetical protein EAZ95_17445 [Bacteroidota bacterium]